MRTPKAQHIIFGFHGYPQLVRRLTYRRGNRNLHVRGYKKEGTIITLLAMPEIRHWQWPGNVKNAKTIKPRAELETAHDG